MMSHDLTSSLGVNNTFVIVGNVDCCSLAIIVSHTFDGARMMIVVMVLVLRVWVMVLIRLR